MTTHEAEKAAAYVEEKARRLRQRADEGRPGWAGLRHDARVLEAVASEIRAGFHLGEEGNG